MALDLAGSLRAARTVLDARVTNCWVKIEEKGRGKERKVCECRVIGILDT